ncbi:Coiled-coil-helix-coiled-coil-helix domain-containing protein 6 [Chelonia mydas]|uniref:Coiled-coil-helix-coiled-coil-helix domain-containing protein 6 n=1 Tax=Chelonia mydas TaxID=8469 RepID=M7C539_CHEMY|nr:Coiled-coil-helix-coiled-coil-helix domain-containing protein 6 [Chelonia mydas]
MSFQTGEVNGMKRLSEDVVNRMKETSQLKGDKRPSSFPSPSSYGTASSPQAAKGKPKCTTGIHPPTTSSSGQKPSEAEEELYKRYEQEQALVQEELLRLAKREREAGSECLNTTLQREKNSTNEERQKATRMAPLPRAGGGSVPWFLTTTCPALTVRALRRYKICNRIRAAICRNGPRI